MKKPGTSKEKWLIAVLGVVCVGAIVHLLRSSGVVGAGTSSRPSSTPAPPSSSVVPSATRGSKAAARPISEDDLARYNPELRLDLLDDLENSPLATFDRNPFQYGLTPAQKVEKKQEEVAKAQPAPPPPPPPPPPVNLKAMGYSEGAAGVKKAMLQECAQTPCPDDAPQYDVKEGESFGNRYKALKITETSVEVEDETYHQTVQLPYPQ